jgi:3-isopropylmalate dehydrogenase
MTERCARGGVRSTPLPANYSEHQSCGPPRCHNRRLSITRQGQCEMREFHIAVFPGDGIGHEVMAPCLDLLDAVVVQTGGFRLRLEQLQAGAQCYLETGVALPEAALSVARSADAILLGAMGIPDVRYPNGTEVVPQIDLREHFELYAGIRPVRVFPGVPIPLADPRARTIDFVLVRESTEGLFSARTLSQRQGDDVVLDTMRITRRGCERLFKIAFQLAQGRRHSDRQPRLTCVDKANVLPSMAFFRDIFFECAAQYPDVQADCAYVDAVAMRFVRAPWEFDVLVTENMFGDILSDLGAGLMGGMGMAPSADIGDVHAVFQPCHGTAPDIAGRGLANPSAMFLSAAMMLDWLGDRHDTADCHRAAAMLTQAVEDAFADGTLVPIEYGGSGGTAEITDRVQQHLTGKAPTKAFPS